ncbi:MAG: tape measure protein [Prevotella sp.]|nr:tape measure protein [Prevotella sp.]
MPVLAFKVQADWEKVVRLREEITKLKAEMKGIDAINSPATFNTLNQRLKQCTTEFNQLTTEAVEAGAKIESGFKRKIYDAQQGVNSLSEEIIKQKKIIADTSNDLKVLTDKYKDLKSAGQKLAADSMLPQINKVRGALDEEKRALFDLTQERATAQLGVKKLREEYQLFAKDSGESVDVLGKMKSQLLGIGKGMLAGMGLKELASDIIRVRGQFQQTDTAITTLLGSKERADELLSQVREYAKISPLEFGDITAATQMMLGFNIEAEKVPGFIKAIGDVSMGESGKFNSLTLAFSQMSATGKLMGQDLNQMINAGFNPLQVMAEKTGKSIAQLKEEMSKGAITSEMVQQAFIDATSAGGKFFNMSENAAKTINGQLSMMHDAIDSALNEIGTKSEGMITTGISGITKLIENYETVGRVLLGLATTYGTYRTAVALVTFAQNGHTLAMTMARAQILLTQKAQALLNATMLANPYVLAAVALGGLLGVVIAASDGLNAAEKAQRDFNATLEEAQKKQSDYNAETEKAINLANNDAAATGDRQGAMDLLIQRYPTIIQKYIDEEGHLRNILQLKREIAEIDGQRAVQGYQNESARFSRYAYLADQVRKAQTGGTQLTAGEKKEWEEAKKYYFEKHGWTSKITDSATDIRDYFQQMSRNFNQQAERQTAQNSVRRFQETIAGYTEAQLKQLQNALQKAKGQKGKVAFKGYSDLEGAALSQGDIAGLDKYVEGLLKAKGSTVINKAELTKRKKKLQAELDALSVEAAAGERGAALKKKIEAIDRQLGNYSTSSKRGKGTTADDVEEKKTDVLSKQKLAQERAAKDLEFSTREAQIKAMQDGTDRVLAQIELDRDREEEAIRRSYEDMRLKRIEEARKVWDADPVNKGKNFYDSQEYKKANANTQEESDNRDARLKAAMTTYQRALDEQRRTEAQAMYDYLAEYGTYQQKKLAIAEEYAAKIAEANKKGDTWTARKLEAESKSKQSAIDTQALKQNIDWQAVLGGFTSMLGDQLKNTLASLKEYVKTPEFASKNESDQQVIYQSIEKLQGLMGGGKGTLNFSAIKQQMDDLGVAVKNLQNAKAGEYMAYENLEKAQKAYQDAMKNGTKAQQDEAKMRLELAQKVADSASNQVQVQTTAVQNFATNLKESEQDTVDGLNMVAEGLQGFASNSLSGAFQGIQNMLNGLSKLNIGGKVGEAVGKLSDTLSSAGFIGQLIAAILSILDILKDGFGTLISNLLDTVFNAINGILSNILSLDFVGQIGGSLVKGVGNILNTVTFGGFNSWFGVGGNEAEVAETTERLTKENEELRKSIDRLKDAMDNTSGLKAINNYEHAYEMQQKSNRNLMEVLHAQMGYHSAHHSNNYYASDDLARSWNTRLNNLFREHRDDYGKNSVGSVNLGHWNAVYEMTPEQLAVIRDYASDIWEYMTTVGKYDKSEYWENAANAAGELQALTHSIYENLTQMSFDSLRDNFLSSLMDMSTDWDDTLEGMMDDFEEMFRKASLNFALSSTNEKLRLFWEDWGERMKQGTELTQDDINYYKARYQALVEEGLKERERIAQLTGYDGNDEKEQSATANGIEKMTHDDAGAIEGRLTATQIAVEQGNTKKDAIIGQMTVTNMTLSEMRSISIAQREIADDTRDILANSYLELREINEHQDKIEKAVIDMQSDVEEMKNDIKDLK